MVTRHGYIHRYIWFVAGILINSFGIAVITRAALGTSPISSTPYVLSLRFQPSLGQFTFAMNTLFILMQAVLLRREFKPVQCLQILVNVVFSVFIDISMSLLSWLQTDSLAVQVPVLVLGCAVLAFGISIEVAPDVLVVPGEGIVKAIARVSHKKFGTVKVAFDVTLTSAALLLSFLFFHRLRGLGIGTIISAVIVGKLVGICNKRLPLIAHIAAIR